MNQIAGIVLVACIFVAIATMLWWIARDKERPRLIEIDWRPQWYVELRQWWEKRQHPLREIDGAKITATHRDEVIGMKAPANASEYLYNLHFIKKASAPTHIVMEWPERSATSDEIIKTAFVGSRMFVLTRTVET